MSRPPRRRHLVAGSIAILLAVVAIAVWIGAVERWIGQELRALAAAHLEPSFDFDDLSYRFPSTVTLRGVVLTSPDAEAKAGSVDILAVKSLTLSLSEIPWPKRPFRMQRLDLSVPTVRLVRIDSTSGLLGYSNLLKDKSEPAAPSARPPPKLSELFQVRSVSIGDGRIGYDSRDGDAALMLIDGIDATLSIQPGDAGSYDLDFLLDHDPVSKIAVKGKLLADDKRLEVAALSASLDLARENDHYLTPDIQKFLAARAITGRLKFDASGTFDLSDPASSNLKAALDFSDATFAAGDYRLALDRVDIRISTKAAVATIEKFEIAALAGHATVGGTLDLDESLTSALTFGGTDLQIGDLHRGPEDPKGEPRFSGLLGFSGTFLGPLAEADERARGSGQLTLRKARLARLPVLSTIDTALDATAEALMKREHTGHDSLSVGFAFEEDRAHIERLRMNSRWYGLRGHGDVFFDSRLDLAVDGGPIERLENELGAAGDLLGEITETILRARVTGTLGAPKVGIEVLRHSLHW